MHSQVMLVCRLIRPDASLPSTFVAEKGYLHGGMKRRVLRFLYSPLTTGPISFKKERREATMRGKQSKCWLLVLLTITMAPALAQTCRDDIPASAPHSRYTDNGDGTVVDRATGLIWKQCAEGLSGSDCLTGSAMTLTWQAALQRAADTDFADSSNWRLPNVTELLSLVEQRCTHPASNRWQWPNTPPLPLWSSTPDPDPESSPHSIWTVDFDLGAVRTEFGESTYPVRLVHGGW